MKFCCDTLTKLNMKTNCLTLIFIIGCISMSCVLAASIPKLSPGNIIGKYKTETQEEETKAYLKRYGHEKNNFIESLKSLQQFAGLPATGRIDEKTIKLLKTPRCGMPDGPTSKISSNDIRRKRYVTAGKWRTTKNLTYIFQSFPTNSLGLTNQTVRNIFRNATMFWTSVVPIKFIERMAPPYKVRVTFAKYSHGDCCAFDGALGSLGHSYPPEVGYNHYDDSEQWSDGVVEGINLLQTMVHELGHILGLAHSPVTTSVMFPYYYGYNPNFKLDPDDIQGMQSLYGPV